MQRIKLDINPKGEIPVLYVSQYDKGRLFEVELVEGDQAYNLPLEYSVQLNVRKTDSKLVTAAPETIVDNILTFATTEQMTACAGENIGSVTLKDADDIVITTLYFLISVQRDVLAGGIDSASEIHNLEEQIAAIIPEVIGDDYYNKTETNALLANKANISDLASLASKAELTQAILDEDRALKAWVSSNFATPGYVNERIFNILPVGSVSGNPCIFNTEIAAALQALTAKIVCGGGGGTPSSPIPLVPHSALSLDVNGQTFTVAFGQTVYGGVYDKSGRLTIEPINKVTLTGTENWSVFQSGSTSTAFYISGFKNDVANTNDQYCSHFVYNQYAYQADAHENTFLQGTSGNLIIQVPNSLATTVEDFKTWLATQYANDTPVEYRYNSTATPIVIDVPSISVFAVKGENNITSDCIGDVNVNYKDTIQHYIDQRLQ